jgi:hypothetical protein
MLDLFYKEIPTKFYEQDVWQRLAVDMSPNGPQFEFFWKYSSFGYNGLDITKTLGAELLYAGKLAIKPQLWQKSLKPQSLLSEKPKTQPGLYKD